MTISELEKQGYEGCDANLDINLFEYGLAWLKNKENDYTFIYGISIDEEGNYTEFEFSDISKEDFIDIVTASWFDLASCLATIDSTKKDFIDSYPFSILDCIYYHGTQNIFGTSYDGGFSIANN